MWIIIIVCIIGHVQGTSRIDRPVVDSPAGLIRGLHADNGDYFMYLGIPYAKVNEDNPFGLSSPHPKFTDVFDAAEDSVACPQEEEFRRTIIGSLDCLRLNVFVPNTTETKLPVLVWIHGGHFTIGLGGRLLADPKYLVRHDIIVVTVNYRLGVYGFMCLDTPEVPGNQGLKDQNLAFKWVFENIQSFGGDSDKITLMGESAGAMSLDMHLMSEQPKLYNQAILQSGSGIVPSIILQSDITIPLRLAEHLGFVTNDLQEAITFLAKTNSDLIIAATLELNMRFRPCVEKKFENEETIVGIHPEHFLRDYNISKVKDMRILAGFNRDEQMYLHIDQQLEESFFYDYIVQEYNAEELEDMINKVRRFYIGDEEIKNENIWKLIEFASDIKFNHPVQRSIIKYLDNGANVYQYMFSYDGGRNYVKILHNVTADGVAHGDELGYLFGIFFITETPTDEDQKVIDIMTTLWANFVKHGNPTPTTSDLIPVIWTQASRNMISYLDISSELTMGTRPYYARMSFWDLFYAANQDQLWANIIYTSSSSIFTLSAICSVLMIILFYIRQI